MLSEGRLALLLLLVTVPLLLGMRDPFRPPEDRCRLAELARWRYGGAAGEEGKLIGFIKDPGGRWHRVKRGGALEGGREVLTLTAQEMEIALDAECEPARWRWLKEGARHEARNAAGGDAAALQRDDGQRDAGNAGGG